MLNVTDTFDAIIIGTGQAAAALANRLTTAGMSVAVIERHLVGGTCVNGLHANQSDGRERMWPTWPSAVESTAWF